MPELAEVALYARDLCAISKLDPLRNITFLNRTDGGKTIIPSHAQKTLRNCIGKTVSFRSFGKALWLIDHRINLPSVEFRLGMTGQFQLTTNSNWKRHYFIRFDFGDTSVFYADPRRFGRVLVPSTPDFALGGFSNGAFFCHKYSFLPPGYATKPRISWLLDNGEKTGVGNYMANEALGRLNLSPFEPCTGPAEARHILRECLKIARQSFRSGGNSFGSGFYMLNGIEGQYGRHCRFYRNPSISRIMFRGRPLYTTFLRSTSNVTSRKA